MNQPTTVTPITICNLRVANRPVLFRGPFSGNELQFKEKLNLLSSSDTIEILSYNINNGEIFVFLDISIDDWIGIIFGNSDQSSD